MKKGRIIAGSVLSIIMCSSLIAGATMALFTSESTTNIAVTSGNVDVQATASITGGSSWNASKEGVEGAKKFDFTTKEDKQYSAYYLNEDATTTTDTNGNKKVTFKNQGSAYIGKDDSNEDALILNNITPGDAVKLGITIENNSNVAVNYRIKFYCDNEYKADDTENKTTLTDYTLFDSLKISIPVSSSTKYTKASLSGVSSYTTAWMYLAANAETGIKDVEATIELPLTIGNDAMNRTCKIKYVVEAVQGNAALNDNQVALEYIDGGNGTATIQQVETDKDTTVAVASAITTKQTTESGTVENVSQAVNVTIPKAATSDASNVTVSVKETTVDSTVTVNEGDTTYAFDVTAYADGEKTTSVSGTDKYQISFNIGTGVELSYVYHNGGDPLTTNNKADEYYEYNEETGVITIYTKSLSPFVISYFFGGGLGTEAKPYLIYTADQLTGLQASVQKGNKYQDKYFTLKNNELVMPTIDGFNGSILYYASSETEFDNLINKVNNGDTIKLTENITLTTPITINKSITLDLNEKIVTCEYSSEMITISGTAENDITVTFKNGTMNFDDTPNSGSNYLISITSGATLTLVDATINFTFKGTEGGSGILAKSDNANKPAVLNIGQNANIKFDSDLEYGFYTYYYGVEADGAATVNINGGEINISNLVFGIYAHNSNNNTSIMPVVNLSSGSINVFVAGSAIMAEDNAQVNMSGGTITVDSKTSEIGSIAICLNILNAANAKFNMTGGEIVVKCSTFSEQDKIDYSHIYKWKGENDADKYSLAVGIYCGTTNCYEISGDAKISTQVECDTQNAYDVYM